MPDQWGFDTDSDDGVMTHICRHPGCHFPYSWREVPDEEREQHWLAHQRVPHDVHSEERDPEGERRARAAADRRERRHNSHDWRVAHRERECANEYCRKLFIPRRIDHVYHDDACRQAAGRRAREDA